MQTISPYLTINGAEKALEFYQKAFGATDIFRHPDEDGKRLFHARMTINGRDHSKDHGGPPAPTLCCALRTQIRRRAGSGNGPVPSFLQAVR
jgi:hypothetical protein